MEDINSKAHEDELNKSTKESVNYSERYVYRYVYCSNCGITIDTYKNKYRVVAGSIKVLCEQCCKIK